MRLHEEVIELARAPRLVGYVVYAHLYRIEEAGAVTGREDHVGRDERATANVGSGRRVEEVGHIGMPAFRGGGAADDAGREGQAGGRGRASSSSSSFVVVVAKVGEARE